MLESHAVSVRISCDWHTLYERIWRPENFPEWATGLSGMDMHREGSVWKASGPNGMVRIRFTDHNDLGVMDHWVELADGQTVYVPLRVITNGEGAEVQLTLFRQRGMTNDRFAADAEWVRRDFERLRLLASSM
ncbi:MAG: polyketide cyclase [Gallionella sp.]|nr:polyketide cyclase [Gallionella sp.]MDD4946656.1 polyketide cyclase [Gallionella sp.]MDD5611917.1 polyketide cyclase [Gallionella sp.]